MSYANLPHVAPRSGWLPVNLPDGTFLHVEVDAHRGTVDLVHRATGEPTGDALGAIRNVDAAYLVQDVGAFIRACLEEGEE